MRWGSARASAEVPFNSDQPRAVLDYRQARGRTYRLFAPAKPRAPAICPPCPVRKRSGLPSSGRLNEDEDHAVYGAGAFLVVQEAQKLYKKSWPEVRLSTGPLRPEAALGFLGSTGASDGPRRERGG